MLLFVRVTMRGLTHRNLTRGALSDIGLDLLPDAEQLAGLRRSADAHSLL
jgi:hypothetical protein